MAVLIYILGIIFGSFFLVVGTRLPKGESIKGRSRCDHCRHELKWYELIPIFSYLFQFGKCNYCQKKISIDHLLIELFSGLLFLAGYLYFGISLKYAIYLVSISVGLIIFISDFKYMIILDSPLVIGSILLLVIRYFEVGFKNALFSFGYGIIIFLFMYIVKLVGDKLFKKESLGGGDIKLGLFIGILLGYYPFGLRLGLISVIFASFLALPYALGNNYLNKKNELPYGPFLISAAIIIFIFIEKFMNLFVLFNYLTIFIV